MHKVVHDTGMEELTGWHVCGAVYCTRNPPVSIRDIAMVPYYMPMPSIDQLGCIYIEMVAQVGVDIAESLLGTVPAETSQRYVAELRYTFALHRRHAIVNKTMHVGEILATDNKQEFVVRLVNIPPVIAQADSIGHIHPFMLLIPQNPVWTSDRLRRLDKMRKRMKDQSEQRIIGE